MVEGFNPAHYAELAALEPKNYWFRARNRLIIWALQHQVPAFEDFLEIGCGTGYVLQGVSEAFPLARITASETRIEGLRFAAKRAPRAELLQFDARHIPFEREFDVVGAFDVLEHIQEDEQVLKQMQRTLRPGGTLLLTVPQHPFLWSDYDVHAGHVRRYTRSGLRQKLEDAGFFINKMTSFVTLLLPLMMLSRLARPSRTQNYDTFAELRISGVTNTVLELTLDAERLLIRTGLSMPFGGSLLVIGRRLS